MHFVSAKQYFGILFGFLAAALFLHLLPTEYNPYYILLGICGAIFANSTGAGGGVIFIPTFQALNLSAQASLSTSFGIQSFGMTAGAISWLVFHIRQSKEESPSSNRDLRQLLSASLWLSIISIVGIYSVRIFDLPSPASFVTSFRVFSVILGLSIIAVSYRRQLTTRPFLLSKFNSLVLGGLAFGGGIITAWLSVGVGELLAFYLIFRRYPIRFAIAVAVIVSAATVLSVAPHTFDLSVSEIRMDIVVLAGPAAVVGGYLARWLVERIPEMKFKRLFGLWLLIVGIFG